MIPSFSFSSKSEAKSGDATQGGSESGLGAFNVNFGNGVSQGGGAPVVPGWVWLAGAALVGVIAWKRFT